MSSSSSISVVFLLSLTTAPEIRSSWAGFAGLSVAWHLLQHSPKELNVCIEVYDEDGVGGGASGVSWGLLHLYFPKGTIGIVKDIQDQGQLKTDCSDLYRLVNVKGGPQR